MNEQHYMSWFRQVVEMGWTCGLYSPPEILLNYLIHGLSIQPYDEPVPYEHINRYMIDTTQIENLMTVKPTLREAIDYFNAFYTTRETKRSIGVDFGALTRETEHAQEE